jgi:hypothetical protein
MIHDLPFLRPHRTGAEAKVNGVFWYFPGAGHQVTRVGAAPGSVAEEIPPDPPLPKGVERTSSLTWRVWGERVRERGAQDEWLQVICTGDCVMLT